VLAVKFGGDIRLYLLLRKFALSINQALVFQIRTVASPQLDGLFDESMAHEPAFCAQNCVSGISGRALFKLDKEKV